MADQPVHMHAYALDHLRYIRETMERAGAFTALPGIGSIAIGATAIAAAWLSGPPDNSMRWLRVWLADACVAAVIGVTATAIKGRRSGTPLLGTAALRFAIAYVPPLVAGVILTAVFAAAGLISKLPGCWLLLYGTALTSGGAFSVRIISIMGLCFMALGAIAFATPAAWGHGMMAIGFGGLHIVFGIRIAKTYGG